MVIMLNPFCMNPWWAQDYFTAVPSVSEEFSCCGQGEMNDYGKTLWSEATLVSAVWRARLFQRGALLHEPQGGWHPKVFLLPALHPQAGPHTNASTIRLPLTITGCKSDTFRPCDCPMMGILSHCLKCELFAELPVVSICMSPFEPSQSCLG